MFHTFTFSNSLCRNTNIPQDGKSMLEICKNSQHALKITYDQYELYFNSILL